MFNKLQKSAKSHWASKFFSSILLTGGMLLFVLKPAFSSNSAEVKAELMQILKTVPVKERKIVKSTKDDEKTYTLNKQWQLDSVPPDTTTIKNFFLNGGFLTPEEVKDFNSMRNDSKNSPSRPIIELTIFDIRETTTGDYEKAIFITSFLDPFQKTALGKSAFQTIDGDDTLKWSYSLCCKLYTQNIKTIKLETEKKQLEAEKNKLETEKKQLEETLKLLKQLEEIYKKYLNK